jgi:hypothetical protein
MQATTVTFPNSGRLYIIENFLERSLAQRVLDWFQAPSDLWQADKKFSHQAGRLIYTAQHAILEQVLAAATTESVLLQLSAWTQRPIGCDNIEAWVDLPGYSIDTHQDLMAPGQEYYGLQIFFARSVTPALGTCFCALAPDPVFNLPLRQNLAYFVDRGDLVRHGMAQSVPQSVQRYSLHLKYKAV